MHTKRIKKMLIIVPRTSLVIQTTEDFENYSMDKKTIKYKSQMIGGGRDKSKSDVNLVVGTYQSLSKLDPDFFKEFDIVCVDESQSADSTSVKKILKMCTGVKYKFGLSGTTKTAGDTAESLTMISLLGPLVEKVSGKYLTDNGFATPIKIKMIFMDYLDEEMKVKLMRLRTKLKAMKSLGDSTSDGSKMLSIEQQIITENKKRFAFIINVISRLNKNSLVLFKDVKNSYGKKIYQKLKRTMPDEYEIFYIDGSTDEKSRELYKKRMDSNDGRPRILVASFGTFSTGISINALNNVVFVESYKSEVIIKQSIGRGMRKDKDKDVVYIVDFVDNFAIDGYDNYTLKHAYEREQIYKHEKYIYNKVSVKL
jgi:superfamily II DNA or RNA helicase